MKKSTLAQQQKRLDIDLLVIALLSAAVLFILMGFNTSLVEFVRDPQGRILLRFAVAAALQFGLAGLGITVVCLVRRESFCKFGLRRKGALLSVVLCGLCFVPQILFLFFTRGGLSYLPFQGVYTTKKLLAAGFPLNIFGMLLTVTVWGFFEGFNYAVICQKINERYPGKNKWLNWGAISCAIFCILIHGAIGVTPEGIIEMATVFIVVYGMLLVKEFTGNAWGCVFIFIFFWNALA